jgi:hypothetical protein
VPEGSLHVPLEKPGVAHSSALCNHKNLDFSSKGNGARPPFERKAMDTRRSRPTFSRPEVVNGGTAPHGALRGADRRAQAPGGRHKPALGEGGRARGPNQVSLPGFFPHESSRSPKRVAQGLNGWLWPVNSTPSTQGPKFRQMVF